jgi:hypothetical protein
MEALQQQLQRKQQQENRRDLKKQREVHAVAVTRPCPGETGR